MGKAFIKDYGVWFFITLLLWLLFMSLASPAYLVEGTRNIFGLLSPSKEAYVYTVMAVRAVYVLVTVVLTSVAACWLLPSLWRRLKSLCNNL